MSLIELLACSACRQAVCRESTSQLRCVGCERSFPIVDGVPVMLLDPNAAFVVHEHPLRALPGYSKWKERIVLKSLLDSQVALDFGAGNQELDDPCIIRMDLVHGPYVDVVGDVHALPFRDDALHFAFGGAVMEHLKAPRVAADEIYRVVAPGGYVYADWNFLIAYHGYPHHYFNATLDGLRETFNRFRIIELGVGPFHGAAFALRSVLETYLEHFKPEQLIEEGFAALLQRVLWYPLDDFDRRIPPQDRFRVAVSGYVFGVKQPVGHESLIPDVVMQRWTASPELRRRFPDPQNVSRPDNIMTWASGARHEDRDIEVFFAGVVPFSKDPARHCDRSVVRGWPLELLEGPDLPPVTEAHRWALWFSRPLRRRLLECWRNEAVLGVCKCAWWSAKRAAQLWRIRLRT